MHIIPMQGFIIELEKQWRIDPTTVSEQWRHYFAMVYMHDADSSSLSKTKKNSVGLDAHHISNAELVRAYRLYGYAYATTNPLDYHSLALDELARHTPAHFINGYDEWFATVYCGSIGYELLQCMQHEQSWFFERIENMQMHISTKAQQAYLHSLIKAEELEQFIGRTFVGQKRFSIEGGEASIAALMHIVTHSGLFGVRDVLIGMAHRGRLNALVNICNMSMHELFALFHGSYTVDGAHFSGDVKYHLGASTDIETEHGIIHVDMLYNPSHLEAVNPVVLGKARALMQYREDELGASVLPILIHGDAAFMGQGIVTETLNYSNIAGYATGGTIHIIINNQIGFTASAHNSRSTATATAWAVAIGAPIMHVNGDDGNAVMRVVTLALEYRTQFHKDVVIDIVCYRRFGHNESDEPRYTHAQLYDVIHNHTPAAQLYANHLLATDSVTQETIDTMRDTYRMMMTDAVTQAQTSVFPIQHTNHAYSMQFPISGLNEKHIMMLAEQLIHEPEDLHIHKKLKKTMIEPWRQLIAQRMVNWALAEALAFGSIVYEGQGVRLSGEDSGRGTFSHRHCIWWDTQSTESHSFVPLKSLVRDGGYFTVLDSPLSEYGILGFEYGYSLVNTDGLTIWEAQFGDFVNGAQIIIDQFIASAEKKWNQLSGIILLLPHGLEGQGPEHSYGYLGRFLSLCAQYNMQILNITTAAQYFHALRRQTLQKVPRPLIIMTPKSLLRSQLLHSSFDLLGEDTGFHAIIEDEYIQTYEVTKILLCSGKIYYDLLAYREEHMYRNVAIVRIEQLYPFDYEQMKQIIERYSKTCIYFWVQEESRNRGAWNFMREQEDYLGIRLQYAGRPASCSPATGFGSVFTKEMNDILAVCFADISDKKEEKHYV